MGKNQKIIVVCKVLPNKIAGQMLSACDRQFHRAVFIHQIEIRNRREAVILRNLMVHGGAAPGAAIGCIAFHNRSLQHFHQIANQFRS